MIYLNKYMRALAIGANVGCAGVCLAMNAWAVLPLPVIAIGLLIIDHYVVK